MIESDRAQPPPEPSRSSAAPLTDAPARARIRGDLGSTLVVEAAAGTGKTTELVARVVALVRTGRARLDRILAVTFTDKAAGELKLRLRGELERARDGLEPRENKEPRESKEPQQDLQLASERAHLTAALQQLEVAGIGTIHSICADLLREFPLEAGIDPQFEVAAGETESRLFDAAFDGWFPTAIAERLPGVRRLLRRRARGFDAQGPREELRRAGRELIQRRDFTAAWKRPPFDRARGIEQALGAVRAAAELFPKAARKDDWIAQSLGDLHRFIAELDRREAQSSRDEDGLEAELIDLVAPRHRHWNWSGGLRKFSEGVEKAQAIALRDSARLALENFALAADADLAALLREELRPLVKAYELRKSKAGALDFLDLLLRARDLVRDRREVRRELQERFTHILVDEFQDTDPIQAELLFLLASDNLDERDGHKARPLPGKLFVVGDPKQSIYRFRRADIAIYEEAKAHLLQTGATLLHLTVSFRAVPELQEAINAAFAPRMQASKEHSQAAYVALDRARDGTQSRPALIALPAYRLYGKHGSKIYKPAVDESYADATGAFVEWICRSSGWTLPEKGESGEREVPIEPRHICLLFKRFASFGRDLTAPYARALEARGMPHVLVGGRSFHGRPEVLALRNALAAIEWPDDELHVYAALRGPLFALADDLLTAWRGTHKRLKLGADFGDLAGDEVGEKSSEGVALESADEQPLESADEQPLNALAPQLREVAEALLVLRRLHRRRNRRPIAETIAELFAAVRAHAGVALGNAGEQALANLLRAQELARRFEAAGATSFRAFVQRLERDAELGDVAEAAVYEEGAEGVRLMTVHRAKGLEFPVVILCDATAPAVQQRPTRLLDGARNLYAAPLAGCTPADLLERKEELLQRDRDEALRLLYVAATRARDLLVVPILGEGQLDTWLSPLAEVITPRIGEERAPREAPGCPAFGRESVIDRPDDADPRSLSISPGLQTPRVGAHRLVIWDPRALRLQVEPAGGIRREGLLLDLGAESKGAQVARAHQAWQEAQSIARRKGREPLYRLQTVTALSQALAERSLAEASQRASTSTSQLATEATNQHAAAIANQHASTVANQHADTASQSASGTTALQFESVAVRDPARPSGARFGTLVHAVLALADLRASSPERAAQARALAASAGRSLGATAQEIEHAARAASEALEHPLMRRAAASEDCRREVELFQEQPDGSILEGTADLVFREELADGPRWTVVDFKTDAVPEREPKYSLQLGLYAGAIEAASGERAFPVIFAV